MPNFSGTFLPFRFELIEAAADVGHLALAIPGVGAACATDVGEEVERLLE